MMFQKASCTDLEWSPTFQLETIFILLQEHWLLFQKNNVQNA